MTSKKPTVPGNQVTHIVVWNELQRTPATLYGNANCGKGNYTIEVRPDDAATFVDKLKAQGEKALVYHFTGNSSGGGGG